jgi:hypothetical protein
LWVPQCAAAMAPSSLPIAVGNIEAGEGPGLALSSGEDKEEEEAPVDAGLHPCMRPHGRQGRRMEGASLWSYEGQGHRLHSCCWRTPALL